MQGTPSSIGLMTAPQAPDYNVDATHTQMLSAQTPVGTYATYQQQEKENNADNVVVNNQEQQDGEDNLEFAQNQPEVEFGNQKQGEATNSPIGRNPFSTGETPRGSEGNGDGDEADLNLTEGSVQGITPRVPDSQQTMPANPNARV